MTGRGSLLRSVLLLQGPSTLWHQLDVLKSQHQMNSGALSRKPQDEGSGIRQASWCSRFDDNKPVLCCLITNKAIRSPMGNDRWGKSQEVTVEGCPHLPRRPTQWLPGIGEPVMFSLFLSRPPSSSVLLTMPGSSWDLHLPLCFLHFISFYDCPSLFFFVLFYKGHKRSNVCQNTLNWCAHLIPWSHFTSEFHKALLYFMHLL